MPNNPRSGHAAHRPTLLFTSGEISNVIDMRKVISIARRVFLAHAHNAVRMPPKIYIHLDRYGGDFRAMPAYVEDIEACGIKWVNVHPRNAAKGLPTVMALMILSDPKTGYPRAVMDGTAITNLRTGAAGGVAAQCLARSASAHIGFVGCGVQASFQLEALRTVLAVRSVAAYDNDAVRATDFIRMCSRLGIPAHCPGSIECCVRDKDIVVTTTPSRKPLVKASWVSPGTHINAIGADAKGKQELDPAILMKAKIVVDDLPQALHSGEVNVPIARKLLSARKIHATLGQVLAGQKRGRVSEREITVFDSTGLAIQDVAVASYAYTRLAGRKGACRSISFL